MIMTAKEKVIVEWGNVRWAMVNEGFDYCFTGYSNWTEIEDEKFQELKESYIKSQIDLEKYILEKYKESEEC
jgi:hypothetical protein